MANPFIWFDLRTPERDAAERFYSRLLGWEIEGSGELNAGDGPWGTMSEEPEAQTARWLPYVQVEDLEEATRRAVELGATIVQARSAGPAGFFTTISDPGGAQVALWQAPEAADAETG